MASTRRGLPRTNERTSDGESALPAADILRRTRSSSPRSPEVAPSLVSVDDCAPLKQRPRRIRERLQTIFAVKTLNEAAIAKLDRRLIALGVAGHPERDFAARFSAIRAYDVAGKRALLEEAQNLGRAIDAATAVPLSALLAQVSANTAMLHTVAVQVGVDPVLPRASDDGLRRVSAHAA